MTGRVLRGAVVGASSLLGKELAEELNDSAAAWDLTLLDTAEAGGQITSAGDEALMIQPVSVEAMAGMDVVFSSPVRQRRRGSSGKRRTLQGRVWST
jgi:aspartate-semialdehyde dehydrogenase